MTEHHSQQETAASLEPQSKPTLSKRLFVGGLAAILMIAAGVFAFFFMNKTPRELYLSAEMNTAQSHEATVEKWFGTVMELSERTKAEAHQTEATVSAEVDLPESMTSNVQFLMVQSLLKNNKITLNFKQNPESKTFAGQMSYTVSGSPIAGIHIYQDQQKTALKVPFLKDQYFYLKNDKLGEFVRKLNPSYQGIEKIPNFMELNEINRVKSKELREIFKSYGKFFVTSIKKDDVKLKESVDFHGESYRQVTLSWNQEETKTFLTKLLKKVHGDDKLLNLLVAQQTGIAPKMLGGKYADVIKGQREQMVNQMKANLSKAIDEIKNTDDIKGLTMKVIINNDELIVDRTLTVEGKTGSFVYHSSMWNEDGAQQGIYEFKLDSPKSGKIQLVIDTTTKKTEGNVQFQANVKFMEGTQVPAKLTLSATGEPNNMKGRFSIEVPTTPQPISGFYAIKAEKTGDNTYKSHYEIGLDGSGLPQLPNGVKIGLNIDSETTFTEDLNFPKVEENGKNLSQMSKTELQKTIMSMQLKLRQFIQQNLSLLQQ